MRFVGIDPSTKTGLVILSDDEVITAEEIKTNHKKDPIRFMHIAEQVISRLKRKDVIAIEGFSYGSRGKGVSTQYGVGWMIRAELYRAGYPYIEVSPGGLKKFATGKGNTKKEEMILPIYKRWGFEHNSDNVRDAFVLAKIAEATKKEVELTKFQKDVLKKVG